VTGDDDAASGANRHTQAAALTTLGINYYLASHKLQDIIRKQAPCKGKSRLAGGCAFETMMEKVLGLKMRFFSR
jgi:hypothetical protein